MLYHPIFWWQFSVSSLAEDKEDSKTRFAIYWLYSLNIYLKTLLKIIFPLKQCVWARVVAQW